MGRVLELSAPLSRARLRGVPRVSDSVCLLPSNKHTQTTSLARDPPAPSGSQPATKHTTSEQSQREEPS